jgi:hypothetical protein
LVLAVTPALNPPAPYMQVRLSQVNDLIDDCMSTKGYVDIMCRPMMRRKAISESTLIVWIWSKHGTGTTVPPGPARDIAPC